MYLVVHMSSLRCTDTHCHFDFPEFDQDRAAIWQNCQMHGVEHLIIPSVAPEYWRRAAECSDHLNGIYWAVGLHPWWLTPDWGVAVASFQCQLVAALNHKKCVAVGECGLDAHVDVPMLQQQEWLMAHLAIAAQLDLPVILHCRQAHAELLRCLKPFPKVRGVLHGFSGSAELAKQYWQLNIALGVGGVITYARASKTQKAVKSLPQEAIVLETDAPSMPLAGWQGQRNSPEHIPLVAQALATLRGETLADVSTYTEANAKRLFKLG